MDFVFICREAEENSLLSNVAMAMEAARRGQTAAVLFTEDALAALSGDTFRWAPLFASRDAKIAISRGAARLGYPLASEKDNRWTDPLRLLAAAGDAGVALWACPIWAGIFGLDGGNEAEAGRKPPGPDEHPYLLQGIPGALTRLSQDQALQELKAATKVIGGY